MQQVVAIETVAPEMSEAVASKAAYALARECLLGTESNEAAIEEMFIRATEGCEASLSPLLALLIHQGCAQFIGWTNKKTRDALQRSHREPPDTLAAQDTGTERMLTLVNARIGAYDWTLPDGSKIADASYEQIDLAREFHEKQARGNQRRANFYNELMGVMRRKEAKVVRDALTEDELAKLQKKYGNTEGHGSEDARN